MQFNAINNIEENKTKFSESIKTVKNTTIRKKAAPSRGTGRVQKVVEKVK
jgi:hypothetical protein